jgi:hypothetical protein
VRPALVAILCGMASVGWPALAAEQRVAWESFPALVSDALHAFRQTDHWAAEAMATNMDSDRQGRDNEAGRSYNFDPSRHLLYLVRDLKGDGLPEVFLLFTWPYMRGNQQASGVVMVQRSRGEWRIGCDIHDWGDESPRGGIRLLSARSTTWADFNGFFWKVRGLAAFGPGPRELLSG